MTAEMRMIEEKERKKRAIAKEQVFIQGLEAAQTQQTKLKVVVSKRTRERVRDEMSSGKGQKMR
jgi:hypothetical protein